jgi:hypothetical protein
MNRTKLIAAVLALAFLLLGIVFCRRSTTTVHAARVAAGQDTGSARRPTKRALLVGINNYEFPNRVSPLAGSLNDVENMRQVLIGKFEFDPANIVVLKDAQATHAGIMSAIQTLIAKTQPGDIVVFHYSGHGSQMKDVTGTMISGVDETIVPYDSRDPEGKVFDISGAELHVELVQLARKTTNVTFILDSCHSGTLVRGARVRFVEPDTRELPPAVADALKSIASTPDNAVSPKLAFISATTSKESAFEHYAEGEDQGALTYFLTRQLRAAKAGATYRDVMDPVIANVTANYPGQHPALEGAEPDQFVFGDGTSLAGAYVPASPSLLDAKRVTLNTGQVQGATVGSTYDVYPPGSKKFASPEKPTARVQIATLSAYTSEATVAPGGKVAASSRAVEREHHYRVAQARVFLDGVDNSPALQAVRDKLQQVNFVALVDDPTKCNIQLRQVGQNIQTLAVDATSLSPPVPISDPNAADKLAGQLQRWAKWFNVLSIHNTQNPIDVGFTVARAQGSGSTAHGLVLTEGDEIKAMLVNNSDRDLYIVILDLASDGSIGVVYPSDGGNAVLKPGLTLTRTFSSSVPKGRSTVRDVLKVFVSYKTVDLRPLTQGAIKGVDTEADEQDPLQQLLSDAGGVRQISADKPLDLGTWVTVQQVITVKRKS